MIETHIADEPVEQLRLQKFGEGWIHAIAEGALDRLGLFCFPNVNSRVLTPGQFVTLNSAVELVAKYKDWFADCTDFKVEASRVDRIGKRLGISYRFLLRDREDWYWIEQHLFCTLKGGRVHQLHLLCSGFERVGTQEQPAPADAPQAREQDPVRDGLLEFYGEGSEDGSTCTLLTPMIKSRLGGMQSGQVLEVRVDDPTAKGDVEAWSRLSGNPLLKLASEGQILRFFVQKK